MQAPLCLRQVRCRRSGLQFHMLDAELQMSSLFLAEFDWWACHPGMVSASNLDERANQGVETRGVFKLHPVSAAIEDHEARVRHHAGKAHAVFRAYGPVIPAMD